MGYAGARRATYTHAGAGMGMEGCRGHCGMKDEGVHDMAVCRPMCSSWHGAAQHRCSYPFKGYASTIRMMYESRVWELCHAPKFKLDACSVSFRMLCVTRPYKIAAALPGTNSKQTENLDLPARLAETTPFPPLFGWPCAGSSRVGFALGVNTRQC